MRPEVHTEGLNHRGVAGSRTRQQWNVARLREEARIAAAACLQFVSNDRWISECFSFGEREREREKLELWKWFTWRGSMVNLDAGFLMVE